jgi:hypothetical protein
MPAGPRAGVHRSAGDDHAAVRLLVTSAPALQPERCDVSSRRVEIDRTEGSTALARPDTTQPRPVNEWHRNQRARWIEMKSGSIGRRASCSYRSATGRVIAMALAVTGMVSSPALGISSKAQLLAAPVPSACDHPAGTLVEGSLPGLPENRGGVALDREHIALGRILPRGGHGSRGRA